MDQPRPRRQIIRQAARQAARQETEAEIKQTVATQQRFDYYSDPELDQVLAQAAEEKGLGASTAVEEQLKQRLVTRPVRRASSRRSPTDFYDNMYPLDAPGMPLPGLGMVQLAEALGSNCALEGKGKKIQLAGLDETLAGLYRELLYSAGDVHVPISINRSVVRRLAVVTGHKWGAEQVTGPVKARVMVIGKCLGEDEKTNSRQFCGPSAEVLLDTCRGLGIDGHDEWYVTSLLKTEHPLAAEGGSTLKKPWIKEWLPILHQELRIVQPDYILCLGADVTDAMLTYNNRPLGVSCLGSDGEEAFGSKKKASLKVLEGRVLEYRYPVSRSGEAGNLIYHSAQLMAIMNPAVVLAAPEQTEVFENGLARFSQLLMGNRPDKEEEGLDHREVDSIDELKDLYYEIKQDCQHNLLAIDAEWHGEHPQNTDAYVRTIQISWKHKAAVCIHVHHPGGRWRFKGSKKALAAWVMAICRGRRIAGQFLSSDMEWLESLGIDIRPQFAVADDWLTCMEEATRAENPQGGIDTGLAMHAINETGDFALTPLALRYTSAPRYDVHLNKWKDDYCSERKLKKEELEGYGMCPDEILVPYANYDADVTWRIAVRVQKLLTQDALGNNCWEAFWMNMRAQPAVLEMNCTGVEIDQTRLDKLTRRYIIAQHELSERIRAWACWPGLNLNSVFEVREFLFGEALNGKEKAKPTDPPIRLRPAGAKTLRLTPIMTTDKRPMLWEEVLRRKLENSKTASTSKQSLAILAQENQAVEKWNAERGQTVCYDLSKYVNWIRDYRFISQVLKSVLRVPTTDKETEDFIRTSDGFYVYPGGLPASMCSDKRVRTHLYQTKETGRWSSARPPLQNISKRREADYYRILGANYLYPIRTVIKAPAGHFLVEADYSGAELYGMAIMAGDSAMISDYESGADIHSQIAVLAFNLKCPPTKEGLRSVPNPRSPSDPAGCTFLRIVAKSVVFGIAYGRAAKAIALAAKEEGINITVDDAQRLIDTIFHMYPRLVPFFAECRSRSVKERWLCGCFGRFRRFQVARDKGTIGDFERQSMNFPIQNLVSDAVSRAVDHLYHYRTGRPVQYKLALQIHDAVLLQVPYAWVGEVMDTVLPTCMTEMVPVYPTNLAGEPTGTGPYKLKIETEVSEWWGEMLYPDQHLRSGVPLHYSHWKAVDGGYTHKKFKDKIWVGDEHGGKLESLAV